MLSRRVLIDDRIDLAENWEARGGIFVHHTHTERTLRILKEHGVLAGDSEVGRVTILYDCKKAYWKKFSQRRWLFIAAGGDEAGRGAGNHSACQRRTPV